MKKNKYLIQPNINNSFLFDKVSGFNELNEKINTKVVQERPLTIFLNNQEIVTLMSINDYPEYLAIGYLLNQDMIFPHEKIKNI